MNNKKIYIAAAAILVLAAGTYWFISSRDSGVTPKSTQEKADERSFSQATQKIEKIIAKSISNIALVDNTSQYFPKIADGKIAFISTAQEIYIYNLENKNEELYLPLPDKYLDKQIISAKFNDDLSGVLISFDNAEGLVYGNLKTKTFKQIDAGSNTVFAWKNTGAFYAVENLPKVTKINLYSTSGSKSTFAQIDNAANPSNISATNNSVLVASPTLKTIYLATSDKIKMVVDGADNLLVDANKSVLRVAYSKDGKSYLASCDESGRITKSIELPAKAISINGFETTSIVSARYSDEAYDKLLEVLDDGKIKEVTLPTNKLPGFVRVVKIDNIISAQADTIYYENEGVLFEVKY